MLLRTRSRRQSFVSCSGPLPWFARRQPHVPLASKRGNRSLSGLAFDADREPPSCGDITGTGHRFGASRPGLRARRAGGGCLALASKSALRLSIRAMRGSLLRYPLKPILRLLSCKLRPASPLRGNPRALGFCSPPLCRSAPRAAFAAKKPRAQVLRSSLRPRWFLGLKPAGWSARRREMVSRRQSRKDQSHGYHRICHEARRWPL